MAYWVTTNFESMTSMLEYLNGLIIGSVNINEGANVDGKTLTIDIGAGPVTCTFAPALGTVWTPAQIVTQINGTAGLAGVASIKVMDVGHSSRTKDRRLAIGIEPGALVISTGSANTDFGFSAAVNTAQLITPQSAVHHISEWSGKYTALLYV